MDRAHLRRVTASSIAAPPIFTTIVTANPPAPPSRTSGSCSAQLVLLRLSTDCPRTKPAPADGHPRRGKIQDHNSLCATKTGAVATSENQTLAPSACPNKSRADIIPILPATSTDSGPHK